jgi:hypothetical protein
LKYGKYKDNKLINADPQIARGPVIVTLKVNISPIYIERLLDNIRSEDLIV